MTATLTFNLPVEDTEHRWAVGAPEMASAILELMSDIRGWQKHGHNFQSPEDVMEAIRQSMVDAYSIAQG